MADTLAMTIPKTQPVAPSVASTFVNGHPGPELIRSWDGRGKLLTLPSYGMQALQIAAMADGHFIGSTGRLRTAAQQWDLLHQRYVPYYVSGARDTNYVKAHTWRGTFYPATTWYLVPGRGAMVAVPETSNHGKGIADDVCTILDDGDFYIMADDKGDRVVGLTDRDLIWFRDNAADFGWGLETWAERWHWHWRRGNVLPQRAIDVLKFTGTPIHIPGYMDWEPGAPPPVVIPEPPVVTPPPMPPFDPNIGQYGLWPYGTKVAIGAFSNGDHVRYAKGVLRDQAARFLLWFGVAPGYEYLAGDVDYYNPASKSYHRVERRGLMQWSAALCERLDPNDSVFDGGLFDAVLTMQAALSDCVIDGYNVGRVDADGKIGPSQTWPLIDMMADGAWG
jgi:hypothetical protein